METREWKFERCASLRDGPWKAEPDKKQWTDEATGLPCLIVRNLSGALCGYVGVPPEHPAFKKHYNDLEGEFLCHGGLTFSSHCAGEREDGDGICHIAGEGEPEPWWLGFDCAHGGDLYPSFGASDAERMFGRLLLEGSDVGHGIYRDIAYVTNQCTNLARQLRDFEPPNPGARKVKMATTKKMAAKKPKGSKGSKGSKGGKGC
jgi:hypothetical protein